MDAFNPFARDIQQAAREARFARYKREVVPLIKDKRRKAEAAYRATKHWYQLIENHQPVGDKVEMLGEEAREQNKIFKQRYIDELNAAIDAGKPMGQTGALSRHWVLCDPPDPKDTEPRLSVRQQEIVNLRRLYTTVLVARMTGLSVSTINQHLAAAYRKMRVHSFVELCTALDAQPKPAELP